MFTVVSFYRVKKHHTNQFIALNQQVGLINMSHGAIEHEIYLPSSSDAAAGLSTYFQKAEDEDFLFGQITFRNQSHYEEVSGKLKEDGQIQLLTRELAKLIDTSHIVTASFSSER
ncbi:DUF1428 family protein [Sediminibacillus dalangtanensis]|uniref:DUF1428 family protein n=1 Tax=Sediminibacillus dalangtanensis TaxID=2729421 RepID=A0ABX7VPD1_9BACI|nr:DUF1428 family protein [Sediminibacillus dalangtanensis]QTM98318.1 DUF1428 family protein [Sediminibacillus dalangtanensis]